MEKPTPNFMQNSLMKSKENYPQKAKGMSFFAFLFSIFIYTSIFYIFNLSPSKVFTNTKFWFFISNTLIIIILVDYGGFSSSSSEKQQHDLYQEYLIMRRQTSAPSFQTSYSRVIKPPEEEDAHIKRLRKLSHQRLKHFPSDKTLVAFNNNNNNVPAAESSEPKKPARSNSQRKKIEKHCTFMIEDKKIETTPKHGLNNEGHHDHNNSNNKAVTKTLLRSKSDIPKRVVIDESKNIVRRVETEKYDSPPENKEDEEETNKYANMSDEELNRRVEDFIQRFNRQIRLQRDLY